MSVVVQVRQIVNDPEERKRVEAQREFARSLERLPPFPPPPRNIPSWQGWLLEDWIPPAPSVDNIETVEVVVPQN
jgi:hypothetical protein